MKVGMDDVVVVGAGISGLVVAKQLSQHGVRVRLLEARPTVGGRLRTVESIDMGAAWSWTTDKQLRGLASELGVGWFDQPAFGKLVMDATWGRHEQHDDGAAGPGAVRFEGGAGTLALRLHDSMKDSVKTHLNAPVKKISVDDGGVECVFGDEREIARAKCVVVTAPPRVALGIDYSPPLPAGKRVAMASIIGWMSDAMKVGLVFDRPFWRDRGYSGTVFSDHGPLSQIWDNSDGNRYALAGFAFGTNMDDLREMEDADVQRVVTEQLVRAFGDSIPKPTRLVRTAWKDEPETYKPSNGHGDTRHYGRRELAETHARAVFFAGTETDPEHGHIEGAVRSGLKAATRVLSFLKSPSSREDLPLHAED